MKKDLISASLDLATIVLNKRAPARESLSSDDIAQALLTAYEGLEKGLRLIEESQRSRKASRLAEERKAEVSQREAAYSAIDKLVAARAAVARHAARERADGRSNTQGIDTHDANVSAAGPDLK